MESFELKMSEDEDEGGLKKLTANDIDQVELAGSGREMSGEGQLELTPDQTEVVEQAAAVMARVMQKVMQLCPAARQLLIDSVLNEVEGDPEFPLHNLILVRLRSSDRIG